MVNVQENGSKNTPLHLAALRCDVGVYNDLVSLGADRNIQNSSGSSPQDLIQHCFANVLGAQFRDAMGIESKELPESVRHMFM